MQSKSKVRLALASALIGAFAMHAVTRDIGTDGPSEQRTMIEANNNTVILIGAEAYAVEPEAFALVVAEMTARVVQHSEGIEAQQAQRWAEERLIITTEGSYE